MILKLDVDWVRDWLDCSVSLQVLAVIHQVQAYSVGREHNAYCLVLETRRDFQALRLVFFFASPMLAEPIYLSSLLPYTRGAECWVLDDTSWKRGSKGSKAHAIVFF